MDGVVGTEPGARRMGFFAAVLDREGCSADEFTAGNEHPASTDVRTRATTLSATRTPAQSVLHRTGRLLFERKRQRTARSPSPIGRRTVISVSVRWRC